MTINKAQGKSFNEVGAYFPEDVFSHGQLYVAFSRVRTPAGLKIDTKHGSVKKILYNEFCYEVNVEMKDKPEIKRYLEKHTLAEKRRTKSMSTKTPQ
ncbi:hypothetical protein NECAME_05245 [Necator americanus]|uniref:ATP-dependent DNA helicase n=1 Tax=Necator americanus TaxID=51031 RepID=W2SII7_NECAM|nr:hypothetical protein NECAME_05245 [Necator americanus]ETN69390.1 hypothetical protein NECAME_05245 [Necator americanus]